MAHLFTGGPAPWEYIELVLCRDVYGCLPSQLRKERMVDVLEHLEMMGVEEKVRAMRDPD